MSDKKVKGLADILKRQQKGGAPSLLGKGGKKMKARQLLALQAEALRLLPESTSSPLDAALDARATSQEMFGGIPPLLPDIKRVRKRR